MKKKRYDAFISYRHCEPDSFVAKTLEKKLETLKLPKHVKSNTNIQKIDRIFRDEDELPVATSLSDQIEYALSESEYLICLCSPRYLESRWCMKEIETFINLYGREKILLVLVDGEPDDSFPELLKKEEIKTIGPDGTEITEIRNLEPLAADVRGKDNKERKKKIEDTALRLSAAMLGINYDDLKQRHRERKMKKIVSAVTTALVCMLIFSLTCLGMLVRIQKQSLEIQAQSSEIQKQSSEILKKSVEIEEKNVEIEAQYKEISTKFAISTAENCLDLLDKGRKADAVYALRQVLPNSIDDTDIPYTPEAQFMLSDALDLYPKEFVNYSSYEFAASLQEITDNGDDYVGVVDESHYLYIYNLNDNRDYTAKFQLKSAYDNSAVFIDKDNIIYHDINDCVMRYNVRTNESIKIYEREETDSDSNFSYFLPQHYSVFSNLSCTYYSVARNSEIDFYDKNNDSVVFTIDLNDYISEGLTFSTINGISDIVISDDSKYAAFFFNHTSGRILLVVNLETKESSFYDERSSFDTMRKLRFNGDGTMLVCQSTMDSHFLQYINLENGKTIWERDDIGVSISDFFYGMNVNDTDCITVTSYDKFYFLDPISGETLKEDYVEDKIIMAFPINSRILFVLLKNGSNYHYLPSADSLILNTSFSHPPKMDIEDAILTQCGLVVVPNNMNYIAFYKFTDEVKETELYKLNSSDIDSISNDMKYYIVSEYDEDWNKIYAVYETETNQRMMTAIPESGELFFVGGNSSQVVLTSCSSSAVYNIKDASKAFAINTVDDFDSIKKLSPDKTVMYSFWLGIFRAYSLKDGSKIGEIDFDDSNLHGACFVGVDNHLIFIREDSAYAEIYDIPSATLINTVYIGADYANNQVMSDDGRYFYISYPNGTRNIYLVDDNLTKINTLYEDYASGGIFHNVTGTDMYIVDSTLDLYLLNKDFKPIMYYDRSDIIDIDVTSKLVYCLKNDYDEDVSYVKTIPYYDYNDLVKLADEYLSDYYPSEAAREQYNILQ